MTTRILYLPPTGQSLVNHSISSGAECDGGKGQENGESPGASWCWRSSSVPGDKFPSVRTRCALSCEFLWEHWGICWLRIFQWEGPWQPSSATLFQKWVSRGHQREGDLPGRTCKPTCISYSWHRGFIHGVFSLSSGVRFMHHGEVSGKLLILSLKEIAL